MITWNVPSRVNGRLVSTISLALLVVAYLSNSPSHASEVANPVAGFEIGNGMIVNRIGGYRFKLPGLWETGHAGALTQAIAPAALGIPRPQIQVDVVQANELEAFTDLDERLIERPWIPTTLGGLEGFSRRVRADNNLVRVEVRLKKSEGEFFLISVDYGVASQQASLYEAVTRILNSFQKVGNS